MEKQISVGEVVKGKVVEIKKFGAFLKLENGEDAFVHISKLSKDYVKNVSDVLSVGQEVNGKIVGRTKDGKVEIVLLFDDDEATKKSDFEKMLNKFLKESNQKLSEYRKRLDRKRGGNKRK